MESRAELLKRKEQRRNEKRDKTICIKIHKKVKRAVLAQVLPNIHPSIADVHFPRQDTPKFAFLVCRSKSDIPEVTEAIQKFKNEDVGFIKPKLGERPNKPIRRRPLTAKDESVLDLLTLILTTTSDITKDAVEKLVPNFKTINTIKAEAISTHIVQFETSEQAFEVFEDLTETPVKGVTVKYFKKKVDQSDLTKIIKSKTKDKVIISE